MRKEDEQEKNSCEEKSSCAQESQQDINPNIDHFKYEVAQEIGISDRVSKKQGK